MMKVDRQMSRVNRDKCPEHTRSIGSQEIEEIVTILFFRIELGVSSPCTLLDVQLQETIRLAR